MCVWVCVCICTLNGSLILSLSVPNGAASGTALYYLSGPVNIKPITLCVSLCKCVGVFSNIKQLLSVYMCLCMYHCLQFLSCTATCQHAVCCGRVTVCFDVFSYLHAKGVA